MKQFDLQGNEYDVQIKDMIEPIPNWEYTYVYEGSRTCGKSYIQSLIDEKDKEIERLKGVYKKNLELVDKMYVKDKEIERLNNIINELEKWLEQEYAVVKANSLQEPNNPEWYIKWNERKNTLDKLQELKGDGSNE